MTAQDYRITTPYGDVAGYELNGGYHKGEDRAMPTGTPVLVNGVQIGLSGNTGYSTGPHLHIGHWKGSQDISPGGGGFTVAGGYVSQVGYDSTNGRFVRVQDQDGTNWVYLHLSRVDAMQGQALTPVNKEADMPSVVDKDNLPDLVRGFLFREPNSDDNVHLGKTYPQAIFDFIHSPQRGEAQARFDSVPALQAEIESLKKQTPGLDQATKDQINQTSQDVSWIRTLLNKVFK